MIDRKAKQLKLHKHMQIDLHLLGSQVPGEISNDDIKLAEMACSLTFSLGSLRSRVMVRRTQKNKIVFCSLSFILPRKHPSPVRVGVPGRVARRFLSLIY
jgi:hypothetical protein